MSSACLGYTSNSLIDDLFGELTAEREIDDAAKKHIKESKAKKGISVYEFYA